ncbi:unnamed protein product [Schistosoma rodhaini]|uniref:Uncharacterized protein n=1 Tax=Schistosoma rodhaini TaxID=6188 RepID=A0AA85EP75_9TREM|nr:unnamed protein product [Schistosoma rodhaini]
MYDTLSILNVGIYRVNDKAIYFVNNKIYRNQSIHCINLEEKKSTSYLVFNALRHNQKLLSFHVSKNMNK